MNVSILENEKLKKVALAATQYTHSHYDGDSAHECNFPLKLRDFGFLAKKFFSAKVVIRCHCDDLKQDIPAENLWFC